MRSKTPAIPNSEILITPQMKSREARRVCARRRPDVWNQGRTVIHRVAREQRMCIREVVVDADHAVVLAGIAFISGDQFAGSISIVRSIRGGQQIEKRLYLRIDRNGDASAGGGVAAAGRVTSGWQHSLMGEGIGYRGN